MTKVRFRPLHENEMRLLQKMALDDGVGDWSYPFLHRQGSVLGDLCNSTRVAYRYQEHRPGVEYTIALVLLPNGSLLTGCTKRNPEDPPNRIRGQVEALRRAFASSVEFELPMVTKVAP